MQFHNFYLSIIIKPMDLLLGLLNTFVIFRILGRGGGGGRGGRGFGGRGRGGRGGGFAAAKNKGSIQQFEGKKTKFNDDSDWASPRWRHKDGDFRHRYDECVTSASGRRSREEQNTAVHFLKHNCIFSSLNLW